MFRRDTIPIWIGIIFLSGMFLMGQETWPPPDCVDNDGDGYGNPASEECLYPEWDCDDINPDVNPGISEEYCLSPTSCGDGLDNDCNGSVDDDEILCQCIDGDGDGYGACANPVCTYPEADCNDEYEFDYPGAPELCDAIDNQCPGDSGYGEVDEGCGFAWPIAQFDGGGGDRDSANYALENDAIGPGVLGTSSSENYVLRGR